MVKKENARLTRSCEAGNGRGGIRTLVTLSRKHAFQACALNHSATRPTTTPLRENTLNASPEKRSASHPGRELGTDRERFELSIPRKRYAGFRDRCLQPLGHLSNR